MEKKKEFGVCAAEVSTEKEFGLVSKLVKIWVSKLVKNQFNMVT